MKVASVRSPAGPAEGKSRVKVMFIRDLANDFTKTYERIVLRDAIRPRSLAREVVGLATFSRRERPGLELSAAGAPEFERGKRSCQ